MEATFSANPDEWPELYKKAIATVKNDWIALTH